MHGRAGSQRAAACTRRGGGGHALAHTAHLEGADAQHPADVCQNAALPALVTAAHVHVAVIRRSCLAAGLVAQVAAAAAASSAAAAAAR